MLDDKISDLEKTFGIKNILSSPTDPKSIARYYRLNKLPLSFIGQNFVHLGLSETSTFYPDDLLGQARLVEKYINNSANEVLELGAGRGGNISYLAPRHPHINFTGLDLPNGQLDYAKKQSKKMDNFIATEGDYHNLDIFPDNYFDLVFMVESLCHTRRKEMVYKQIVKKLKTNGNLIIIDFFIKKNYEKMSKTEKNAIGLAAKGMATENFDYVKDIKNNLNKSNLTVIKSIDLSEKIIPSLTRVEHAAKRFFKLPKIIRNLIVKVFPNQFSFNIATGHLLKNLIEKDLCSYQLIACKK